jgi:hypothetical protein
MREEEFIETSFLIPLHEDKEIGNGKLHPSDRWTFFQRKLYITFEGWTLAPGVYQGCYKEPDTGQEIADFSYKYILAVAKKDLDKLKEFLRTECAVFRQKFIYFEAAGKVELLEVCYAKNL